MPLGAWAEQGGQVRGCFVFLLAALLAIAPFARPSLPVDLTAARAASVESLPDHATGTAQAKPPVTHLRPDQPASLGILSRLSALETALGLPPVKSPAIRPSAAGGRLLAPKALTAFGSEIGQVVHRSSVGTARTPTGPPF